MAQKDEYDEWIATTNYNKKYTEKLGANRKTSETIVQTNDGPKIQQTYKDEAGYTFTIRQKKRGGKITYIAINKPNGDSHSEIRLSKQLFKNWGDVSAGLRKKIMQGLPIEVINNGASLAEIYSNYQDYRGSSVPYDERLVSDIPQKTVAYEPDPFFGDVDLDFDIPTTAPIPNKKDLSATLKAQNTVKMYEAEKKIEDLKAGAKTPDTSLDNSNSKDHTISDNNAVNAYIAAQKSNTI